jgi:ABC-type transport system involved in Fe-S cluster assembly fused permease/ATPase subunit
MIRQDYTEAPHGDRNDLQNLRLMLPFVWEYRGRVLVALACLVLAKLANVGVPLVLKEIVDALDSAAHATIALPIVLLLVYGALKLTSSLFNELRDALFAKVRYRAMRRLAIRVLGHLHILALRYHLERKTGAVSRDLERGTRSVSTILNYMVFNILPTLAEFLMIAAFLLVNYDVKFALVSFGTVAVYVWFTFAVTNWRMHFRLAMNRLDSEANNQAVDSLINYETVKYFGNEGFESRRYDETLERWEVTAVKSQTSMSALNFGQGAIIAVGVTLIMVYAAQGVASGAMSLGDLVLVNAFLLQLFIPLNFLGIVYRQIKYSIADMDMLFKLLGREAEIRDKPDCRPLEVGAGGVRFERVGFSYQADRQILFDVDFEIPPGSKVAVVGPSGAGKSTLARLLFRFFDVIDGCIRVNGQDIRDVCQASLRAAIGIVPQDTVLFNDTIYYNLAYARPGASREDIEQAARLANIHEFIRGLPKGYDTMVGERGLKLSGGEKQRIAIARVILKSPRVLIFDEATSALDTQSEKAIQRALDEVAAEHTTLVIAHRLSTIVDAQQILVMDQGRVVERGSHQQLLEAGGMYAHMWALQQAEQAEEQAIAALERAEGGTGPAPGPAATVVRSVGEA